MTCLRLIKRAIMRNSRHNPTWTLRNFCQIYNGSSLKNESYESLILNNTIISTDHLTPELKLRLITPECEMWHWKTTESKFSEDPFWAIYWPGGQALGRYILDNKELFFEKNVLDIGSGSGACALAAASCGAKFVVANDIDPVSISAIKINSRLNKLKVHTFSHNMIDKDVDNCIILADGKTLKVKWDIILVGDMFYDVEFGGKMFKWLSKLAKSGKTVLVGDPGRHVLKELDQLKEFGVLVKVSDYELKSTEHYGFSRSCVYQLQV